MRNNLIRDASAMKTDAIYISYSTFSVIEFEFAIANLDEP